MEMQYCTAGRVTKYTQTLDGCCMPVIELKWIRHKGSRDITPNIASRNVDLHDCLLMFIYGFDVSKPGFWHIFMFSPYKNAIQKATQLLKLHCHHWYLRWHLTLDNAICSYSCRSLVCGLPRREAPFLANSSFPIYCQHAVTSNIKSCPQTTSWCKGFHCLHRDRWSSFSRYLLVASRHCQGAFVFVPSELERQQNSSNDCTTHENRFQCSTFCNCSIF